ncbi:MAG: hypothetical protein HGA65_06810 [Oscillochloris sp.]|nr:hypothetical protein [Oscillochloris sp.]
MTAAPNLSVDELATRCSEETEKFSRRVASDTQFCFELLRRAMLESGGEALARVFQIYEGQAIRWVYQHSGFDQTHESADFFARAALAAFYFALRGERFAKFPDLSYALAYLKTCVHTSIAQYLRDQRRHQVLSLDDVPTLAYDPGIDAAVNASDLWADIVALLPDPTDQLLARSVFVLGMKPRHIVVAYPQHWQNERDVSLQIYRIRRLLRNAPELRRRMGEDDYQQTKEVSA